MRVIDPRFTLRTQFDLRKVEEAVRAFWHENKIPLKWRRGGGALFSFLEGPPTTNGFPHIGHVRGRTYKDVVLRFNRLMGRSVWAQGGWDEQGLPVELEVEKKLGLRTKRDIEVVGYERFSEECNSLVDYYLSKWRELGTEALALWLDLEGAYETRRARYIEHVWSFLKEMWNRGLLFEDYRVLPFCPRCETALSDAEVDQGYEDREDPSIYVKFPIRGEEGAYLLIWTTTPWTLVDNEAVAVHPNHRYALVYARGERFWVAEALVPRLMEILGVKDYSIIRVVYGRELEGLKYIHVFGDLQIHSGHEHSVVTADFVTLEEGTGLVHIAPAHGPEDFEVARKYNLPVTNSVNIDGVFNELSGRFRGRYWLDVSEDVINELRTRGLLIHEDRITHKYPHCWRCGTPLIYRADKQWFLRTSVFRERMLEELSKVRIYPEFLRERFNNWLMNIRDWTISRSRVWGTPLPIWRCKNNPGMIIVVGTLEELKRLSVELPNVPDDKLVHRPWIDRVKLRTSDCDEWVREPFVVDVWMDSGLAWIAGIDGLRNKELLDKLYPYDFITEAVDQIRGWFYTLLATSVLWRGVSPYKSVLIQGHVVDKYGQKMSKSKGNVIWAEDLFKMWGADAVRLYILGKSSPWDVMSADIDEVREARRVLMILWNVVKFADTYMELDGFEQSKYPLRDLAGAPIEDRWMMSKLQSRLRNYLNHMSNMELHLAAREWISLVIDDLSHSYIRLIRRRVWAEESREDKYVAYGVLYEAIRTALIMGSALVPHITEYLWQSFVRKYGDAEESVHLARMPSPKEDLRDEELERAFDLMFNIFSEIAELRNKVGVKLRWPLPKATIKVANPPRFLEELKRLLEYLANIKEVRFVDILECPSENHVASSSKYFEICLNKEISVELLHEAIARELVRRIQSMRAKLGLGVEERIVVYVNSNDEEIVASLNRYGDYIRNEVRATSIKLGNPPEGFFTMDWDIEDARATIGIKRASGNNHQ